MPRLFSSAQASNAVQPPHGKPTVQHEAEGHPHDLWGRAHEVLREVKGSRKLMDAYEEILLSELQDNHSFTAVTEGTTEEGERHVSTGTEENQSYGGC